MQIYQPYTVKGFRKTSDQSFTDLKAMEKKG